MELLAGESLSDYNRRAWEAVRLPYPDEVDTRFDTGEESAQADTPVLEPLRPAAPGVP